MSRTTTVGAPDRIVVAEELTTRALDKALMLTPGECVTVDAPQYRGPGIVSAQTYWSSHIVWLDHKGICVGVLIPNGNVWLYPAGTVKGTGSPFGRGETDARASTGGDHG